MSSNTMKEFLPMVVLTVVFTLLTLLPATVLAVLCAAAATALLGCSTARFHRGYVAFHSFAVIAVYVLFQSSFLSALNAAVPIVLCGLTLGICYNLKLSVFKLLGIFTSVYVLNVAVNIKMAGTSASGQNIFEEAIAAAGQIYKETFVAAYGAQVSDAEVNSVVSELTSALLRFSPGFIVISCICFAVLCYGMFKHILTVKKNDTSFLTDFAEWRSDRPVSITYFVLMAVYFAAPADSLLSDTLLNMVTIMTFVFFMLGLSFLEFKLKKRMKSSVMRKLTLVGVSLFSFILMGLPFFALAVTGVLDGCLNLRCKRTSVH